MSDPSAPALAPTTTSEGEVQADEEYLAHISFDQSVYSLVYFNQGHTLAKHFDFLAKRLGMSSPADDAKIAARLFLDCEKKIMYLAHIREPLLTDVRRDPGVREVEETCEHRYARILKSIRHPEAFPFPRRGYATDSWAVHFKSSSYKLKSHFEKIGKSFDVPKHCILGLGGYSIPLTEEERYLVLSDVNVESVIQVIHGRVSFY